jgi:hypothetical protein
MIDSSVIAARDDDDDDVITSANLSTVSDHFFRLAI